jgi:chaperonin GroES
MKFQPLGDRVLVEPIKEGQQEVGGIIIPDSAKEKPQQGKVIAIGVGAKDEDGKPREFNVKAGDTVLLPKYGGTEIKLDGVTYQILREDDILGVLN